MCVLPCAPLFTAFRFRLQRTARPNKYETLKSGFQPSLGDSELGILGGPRAARCAVCRREAARTCTMYLYKRPFHDGSYVVRVCVQFVRRHVS